MEYRPLDITVKSAEGIKDVNLFSKMDVYVVVSIAGYPKSKKKTFVDKDCGTNPKWNHHMDFVVDEPYLTKPGLSLHFQLMADRSIGGDKEVGQVTVQIHELYQSVNSNPGEERVVEYQVRTSSGKPKGNIKFSYKFGEKFTQQVETKRHVDEPMTAYPAPPHVAGGSNHQGMGYGAPPHGMTHQQYPQHPPPPGYGYPPPGGYPPHGYGYPPQPGYGGYPPMQQVQNPKKKKSGMGSGLAMGLGAGLLGGMLVGEMAGDAGAYADGYGDGMGDMGDMGGFDF
ncbi:Uncharacterized protein Fot_50819 [Forsythia ovata]|uniref:C2 domain-containing protein n=1 Tax=Forsythia ovata TaxID=205694 RepID=A0ABD1PZA1_9LAMI